MECVCVLYSLVLCPKFHKNSLNNKTELSHKYLFLLNYVIKRKPDLWSFESDSYFTHYKEKSNKIQSTLRKKILLLSLKLSLPNFKTYNFTPTFDLRF